ncbi:MAG: nicotinamide mononucleotide transporter, partial [Proteobacteria bacterium]|nr:nicotinamide mononucleotide transporter [Pseudomonadota bacterium]
MDLHNIINALLALSAWEVMASLLGIGYVLLAARESQWCWPLAFVSTLIYTLLFWGGQLPMQALLNFYYMGMAVYGYLVWRKHGDAGDDLP